MIWKMRRVKSKVRIWQEAAPWKPGASFCVYSGAQPIPQAERALGNCWDPALEAWPLGPALNFSDQGECRLGTGASGC